MGVHAAACQHFIRKHALLAIGYTMVMELRLINFATGYFYDGSIFCECSIIASIYRGL